MVVLENGSLSIWRRMSFRVCPSSELITAGSRESVFGGSGCIYSTVNSDLLPRRSFSQGLSSGFHGCLLELQRATASGPPRQRAEDEWEEEDCTDVSSKGKNVSFHILNPIFFFIDLHCSVGDGFLWRENFDFKI